MPSRMWDGLRIDVGCACMSEAEHQQRPHARRGVDCARLAAWLAARAPCVHTLMISSFHDEPPLPRCCEAQRLLDFMRGLCMHACMRACIAAQHCTAHAWVVTAVKR